MSTRADLPLHSYETVDAETGRITVRGQTAAERLAAARARARHEAVKVRPLEDQRRYVARSASTGQDYIIERTPSGWRCGCQGWTFGGMCKHIGAVSRLAELERWDLGPVARPAPLPETAPPHPSMPDPRDRYRVVRCYGCGQHYAERLDRINAGAVACPECQATDRSAEATLDPEAIPKLPPPTA